MGAVHVQGLGKFYKRYESGSGRLLEWLTLGRLRRHQRMWVLEGVGFELRAGEALAVVGQNGAGKSTLLRIINGTLNPSTGEVRVEGRVAALELSLRFHDELTGRQNLFMSGQLLGIPRAELSRLEPEIEQFSELGEQLDDPVRTYSSGMRLRLGFSIATAVRPEVLLVDEALVVGDARFQAKCMARLRSFLEAGSCVLFVSHDMTSVRSLCDRAVLLEEGRILREGATGAVLDFYNALLAQVDAEYEIAQEAEGAAPTVMTRSGGGEAITEEVELLGSGGPARSFRVGESMTIRVRGVARCEVPEVTVGIAIRDRLGVHVFGVNSYDLAEGVLGLEAGDRFSTGFDLPANLGPGRYTVTVALHAGRTHLEGSYDWWDHALEFRVVPGDEPSFVGTAWLPVTVRHELLDPAEARDPSQREADRDEGRAEEQGAPEVDGRS